MPFFRVQLKQGKRTIVNRIEARDYQDCINFFHELTTMEVSEVLEIKYTSDKTPPIDDFNYLSLYKGFIKDTKNNLSCQIILNNVKLNKSEDDIYEACKKYLRINGKKINSCSTALFKK